MFSQQLPSRRSLTVVGTLLADSGSGGLHSSLTPRTVECAKSGRAASLCSLAALFLFRVQWNRLALDASRAQSPYIGFDFIGHLTKDSRRSFIDKPVGQLAAMDHPEDHSVNQVGVGHALLRFAHRKEERAGLSWR